MRFFFDANLSARLAKALDIFAQPDHAIVHLKDRFPVDVADENWMADLASEPDWIIVSGDVRIRKNPHEVQAWRAAGHATFFLREGWTSYNLWVHAWKLMKCFPEIIATASKAKRGQFFFVGVNGKITR